MKTFFSAFIILVLAAACTSSYKIARYQYQNFPIDQKTDTIISGEYLSILKPYSLLLDSELSEVIAVAEIPLVADRPESPLSNFISDVLLQHGNEYSLEKLPGITVQFSLANTGGLRTSLPAGEIRTRNIFELLPFENELVLLQLSGSQVAVLANHIASRGGEGVAGISFGIKEGEAVDVMIQNKPVNPDENYWMITNDYIANGGDGMKILKEAARRVETNNKIRDVVIGYLKRMHAKALNITAKNDGRIYHVE